MENVVLGKDRSLKARIKAFLHRHSRDPVHLYMLIRHYKERKNRKGECTFGKGCVGCCKTCPLEKEDSMCSVYSIRPLGCKLYPITEEIVKNNPRCTFYWKEEELRKRNPGGGRNLDSQRLKQSVNERRDSTALPEDNQSSD